MILPMKALINQPLNWLTTLSFLTFATLLIILTSWLGISGALPIKMAMAYSNSEFNFIRVWMGLAISIGVLLPSAAFFVWIRHPEPRKVLGFYLLVLIIQIMTEVVLSSVLFPSIVVFIGTIYTPFRLWQLWQGQQILAINTQLSLHNRRLLVYLLWLTLLFWLSNLIILLVIAWPSVL